MFLRYNVGERKLREKLDVSFERSAGPAEYNESVVMFSVAFNAPGYIQDSGEISRE